jgi:predicted enzyme related to lactoylglutathione lyase
MLRREGDRVRIAVLWSTGALTGWEHVFSSETDFGAFAAEIRSQLAGLGPDGAAERVRFERSNPILCVENMQATLHFYVDLLGFENAAWGSDEFTCVSRDAAAIYLCRGGQGRPGAWVWIGVEDASRLHEEYVAKGVAIRLPPTNFAWALEIHVEDPDGNVLRMGSEPLPD